MSAFEKVWEQANEMCNDYDEHEEEEYESDCEICDYISNAWDSVTSYWND